MNKLLFGAFLFLAACSSNYDSDVNPLAQQNDKIIGGESVVDGDPVALSTAALVMNVGGQNESFCTGTLISPDLVLTATHCLLGMDEGVEPLEVLPFKVYVGTKIPRKYTSSALYEVERFIFNSNYKESFDDQGNFVTAYNDIAVIKLKKKVSAPLKPVPILNSMDSLPDQSQLLLAGFGVVNDETMQTVSTLQKVHVKLEKVMDESILVTEQVYGKGACSGDSGGPAYVETSAGLFVIGATRGPHNGAANCHAYGEYTNAMVFIDFIKESAKELGAEMPVFATPEKHELKLGDFFKDGALIPLTFPGKTL